MDLQVKLVKDTVSAMWHIRKALWYGNSYRELRRWLYLHEWTVGGLWEGEEESNYNICQPGMALSNCQILPLFPYSTFSFFQLPLLPFQPLAPPPCAALLYLSNLLCLSPAPRSTTSSNFAFSDEKRPWNTWKFRYLSYHSLSSQWKRCQDQKVCVLVYTWVCMGVSKGAQDLMHLCNGCLEGLPDLAEPFSSLPGFSDRMQKHKDTLPPF